MLNLLSGIPRTYPFEVKTYKSRYYFHKTKNRNITKEQTDETGVFLLKTVYIFTLIVTKLQFQVVSAKNIVYY